MTKKHFEKLAEYLRYSKPDVPFSQAVTEQWERDVHTVADACAYFNRNFDRSRFLRAAGLEE